MDKREFLKGSAAMAAAMMMPNLIESEAFAEDAVPRTNWAGNFHYSTEKVFQPASVADVQDAVRSVGGVRALGTRHAFNGIADSKVAQISTLKLKEVKLDAALPLRRSRWALGFVMRDLATIIDAKGFALHNLASLPHISVRLACTRRPMDRGWGMATFRPRSRQSSLLTATAACIPCPARRMEIDLPERSLVSERWEWSRN